MSSFCECPMSLSKKCYRGTWLAQAVEHETLGLGVVSLSPTSGSVLTAQSLEPASDSVSSPVSAPPMLMLCPSLGLSVINKH